MEISVAIISCESDFKSILLNKVLLDKGCTRTIIKRNKLPDRFSRKQLNEVSWTTNAGKFVIKYNLYSFHYQNLLQAAKLTEM
jgi:hypothetical protein